MLIWIVRGMYRVGEVIRRRSRWEYRVREPVLHVVQDVERLHAQADGLPVPAERLVEAQVEVDEAVSEERVASDHHVDRVEGSRPERTTGSCCRRLVGVVDRGAEDRRVEDHRPALAEPVEVEVQRRSGSP